MANTRRIQFETVIAAPVEKVFQTMIEDASYREWTRPFCEGTYFEGNWVEGERIRFLAPGGDAGMIAEMARVIPNEFISIRHLGMIENGVEDTTSEAVRAWAPAYENYSFETVPGGTLVRVDQDVAPQWDEYMQRTWPQALGKLKAICEAR